MGGQVLHDQHSSARTLVPEDAYQHQSEPEARMACQWRFPDAYRRTGEDCVWDGAIQTPDGLYVVGPGVENPEMRTVNLEGSEITVIIETANNRLSGATFDMWGLTFLLSLHPEERTMKDGKHLMGRNGMDHKFQTLDRKGRPVLSHVLTYDYNEEKSV